LKFQLARNSVGAKSLLRQAATHPGICEIYHNKWIRFCRIPTL